MGAINFGAAVNGAMRGYNFIDEEIDENKEEQMQRTAIDRQYARQDKQDARADRQEQRQEKIYEQQSRLLTRRELEPEAARAWAAYKASGYSKFDPEFAKKAKSAGATDFLPEYYSIPGNIESNIKAADLLTQALSTGNLEQVNSPEFLQEINKVYESKIKQGLGETHGPTGKKIVDKNIVGLDMAPAGERGGEKRGRIVPRLLVTLEDGTTYEAPSTISSSAQDHDPVLMEDVGDLIDDVLGRGQAAKSLSNDPQFMQKINVAESALGYRQGQSKPQSPTGKLLHDRNALPEGSPDRKFYDQELNGGSGSGGGNASTFEKEIEYTQQKIKQETGKDITVEEAVSIIKMPAFDPGKFLGEYVADKEELQSDPLYDGPIRTREQLIEDGTKAAKTIKELRDNFYKPEAESATGGMSAERLTRELPKEDLLSKIMDANPGKSPEWAKAYLQHLESQQ